MKKVVLVAVCILAAIVMTAQMSNDSPTVLSDATTIFDLEKIKANYLDNGVAFHIEDVQYNEEFELNSIKSTVETKEGNSYNYEVDFELIRTVVLISPLYRSGTSFCQEKIEQK